MACPNEQELVCMGKCSCCGDWLLLTEGDCALMGLISESGSSTMQL